MLPCLAQTLYVNVQVSDYKRIEVTTVCHLRAAWPDIEQTRPRHEIDKTRTTADYSRSESYRGCIIDEILRMWDAKLGIFATTNVYLVAHRSVLVYYC